MAQLGAATLVRLAYSPDAHPMLLNSHVLHKVLCVSEIRKGSDFILTRLA